MDELANCFHLLLPSFEDANLIRDRALAELIGTQGEVYDSRKLHRGEVVAVRVDDEADLVGCWWV